MIRYSRPIAAVIKPSGLTVRLPKNIIADDNRNINIALKPIRKELGIHKASHDPKTSHTHPSDPEKLEEAKVNLKNKMHKSLWLTMKKKDAPQFYNLEKQIRASNINMDGITYTLLIHGYIMFKGQHGPYQDLLDEMKLQGIHPALIRFNARIAASCVEMHGHGAKPDPTNVAQMARAAWLAAVLITRRYPTQEHILNMEKRIEREYNLVNKNYGLETLTSRNADKQ
ncbi:uncharacterized protein BBOV_IV002982 [Babesia bovis T2Bo]|uniref:uncharacterized protein n=1 Tax=Babesia bovis T2Bo TaxID=484906 RepID=UPI001DF3499E|nr:uncharacterized protein BBOV_IV002982 [Babesia bovis T2Bo]KAG6439915.1 hypothetical protein BBOV_IV002982 [Babesia bovis T2Bo]